MIETIISTNIATRPGKYSRSEASGVSEEINKADSNYTINIKNQIRFLREKIIAQLNQNIQNNEGQCRKEIY